MNKHPCTDNKKLWSTFFLLTSQNLFFLTKTNKQAKQNKNIYPHTHPENLHSTLYTYTIHERIQFNIFIETCTNLNKSNKFWIISKYVSVSVDTRRERNLYMFMYTIQFHTQMILHLAHSYYSIIHSLT